MAGAGFAIGGTRSTGRVIGANDTIRVAIAGLNGRGGSHVDEYVKMPAVIITYLVDPDTRTFDNRIHQIERFGYRDQGQTANTQISVMDFGDTQLIDGLVKVWDLAEVSGDRRRR